MAARAEEGAAARDAEARRAIREDLGTTLFVEAAAGTGKTTSLVTRMVALVGEGRATVDRLSAVTFTIKAARQLAQRFQEALEEACAAESDLTRRARLDAARAGLSSAFIGTIHAFCARLLRERPVEAGVDPGFQQMEESEDHAERAGAWERFVQRLFVEESPVLARLSDLGVLLEDLRGTYATLCENSDVAPAVGGERPRPDLSGAREAARAFLEQARPMIPGTSPPEGWDEFGKALREALRLSRVMDLARDAEIVRLLEALERAKRPVAKRWGELAPRVLELWSRCERLLEESIEPALRSWREYLHPIVMDVLASAVSEYAVWRRREGRLNYQDLLRLARDLLRDHSSVRRAFQERFTPILVDEFQDTDPIQAEVILYLTGADHAERDWRRLQPIPGSLFVVGDPKQSIYRFRRADIETYAAVRDSIERSGGRVVTLATNFRSDGRLCDWVNDVFGRMLPSQHTESQAGYVPLVADRPEGGAESGAFRLETATDAQRKDPEVARLDAQRVADAVAGLLADPRHPISPGEILVLFRYRRNMATYARALEARGIPFEISGGGAFRASAEIGVLLPFLQAVADPDDPVPLVAALRNPLFGVDDRALYLFHRAGGRFAFRGGTPEGTDPRIARAYELLVEARKLSEELPPGAALARILSHLGWTAYAASRDLGETRAGNLLKAATAARIRSAEGEDFMAVVERLAEMTADPDDDTEEMSTEPGRRDAVQLMTLHRAKGLEGRVVFLADPAQDRSREPEAWIDRREDPPRGYFLVRRRAGHSWVEIARPAGWEEAAEREAAFQKAEEDRLLYVASTRAAETLVVSLRKQVNSRGDVSVKGPWAALARFLPAELPAPAPAPEAEPPPPPRHLERDLEIFRRRSEARRQRSSRPGYAVARVTELAHAAAAGALPFHERTGRGMSWGRVLHRLLEGAMRDPSLDLSTYAANLLAEEERPEAERAEVVRLAEGVRQSPLWQRALAAKRRLVEVPFGLLVPSAELPLPDESAETLLTGAVDLAFEEEEGWRLVDYKSDTIAGNLEELVAFYSPQVALYRRWWEQLTGRPTSAALFFLSTGEERWLE